ncbi:MAG: 1-deoxy-D-xylulose-5-phosphate synthase [Christensenellales bacterium]
MDILEHVANSDDVKKLNREQLVELSQSIRKLIVDTVLQKGGHLSSNLGVVELVVALHYVFDFPKDKLIFDVGHQCYAHKILTGRKAEFANLRHSDGVSGFPKREESEYDVANTGHASTSLSIACGLARALKDCNIVSIVGDGAMTGGLIYEALNDVAACRQKQIIIVNDNKLSISYNNGYISYYLSGLDKTEGKRRFSLAKMGIDFYGSIDGHDFSALIPALEYAKQAESTVMIHVNTVKGKGYAPSENDPVAYHGYSTTSPKKTFSNVFGSKIVDIAKSNPNVWAITAAMKEGVGLTQFQQIFPQRFVDTGIAEGHAMTMASGLALGGKRPVFAVYSSFLQRAFDNLLHDVCLNDLPVIVCIDRAGIVSGDGETHQGIYDVSYLSCMPNLIIMQPKDYRELEDMLDFAMEQNHPVAIRYPKGEIKTQYNHNQPISLGKFEMIEYSPDNKVTLIGCGATVMEQAYLASKQANADGYNVNLVNARFVKPIDADLLNSIKDTTIVVLEDNVGRGSLGEVIGNYYNSISSNTCVIAKNLGDSTHVQADCSEILSDYGLDCQSICRLIAYIYEN